MTNDEEMNLLIQRDKEYVAGESAKYLGKKYTFPDGNYIEVIQIKSRGPGQNYITYHIKQGPGIDRKLIIPLSEFGSTYGHLFQDNVNKE
jgi:hypothetical protein